MVPEVISIFLRGLNHNLDKHMLGERHVNDWNQLFNVMYNGLNHRPVWNKMNYLLYVWSGLVQGDVR